MIKTGSKCEKMMQGINGLIEKAMGSCFSISSAENMNVEDFMLYKDLMKSCKDIMDVCIEVCNQMDEQSKMLEDLHSEIKVTQDGIYELTNKVEEVIEEKEKVNGISMDKLEAKCK